MGGMVMYRQADDFLQEWTMAAEGTRKYYRQ